MDGSISLGEYNNCLIICDDSAFTDLLASKVFANKLAPFEETLSAIFPGSEILTIACHSATNYHLYSLALNGKRLRYKGLDADTPRVEYGERLQEETDIYDRSRMINGVLLFAEGEAEDDDEFEYTEDQLMEDFAFGVAGRHLGSRIDEDDELNEVVFRKYKGHSLPGKERIVAQNKPAVLEKEKVKGSWLSRLFGKFR